MGSLTRATTHSARQTCTLLQRPVPYNSAMRTGRYWALPERCVYIITDKPPPNWRWHTQLSLNSTTAVFSWHPRGILSDALDLWRTSSRGYHEDATGKLVPWNFSISQQKLRRHVSAGHQACIASFVDYLFDRMLEITVLDARCSVDIQVYQS